MKEQCGLKRLIKQHQIVELDVQDVLSRKEHCSSLKGTVWLQSEAVLQPTSRTVGVLLLDILLQVASLYKQLIIAPYDTLSRFIIRNGKSGTMPLSAERLDALPCDLQEELSSLNMVQFTLFA